MANIGQAAGALLTLLAGIAMGSWLRRGSACSQGLERRLTALTAQLNSWQHAYDFHQDELDRRLDRVEEAAARAENESRMLFSLLSETADDAPHRRQGHPT
jgi:hypothetical protein